MRDLVAVPTSRLAAPALLSFLRPYTTWRALCTVPYLQALTDVLHQAVVVAEGALSDAAVCALLLEHLHVDVEAAFSAPLAAGVACRQVHGQPPGATAHAQAKGADGLIICNAKDWAWNPNTVIRCMTQCTESARALGSQW